MFLFGSEKELGICMQLIYFTSREVTRVAKSSDRQKEQKSSISNLLIIRKFDLMMRFCMQKFFKIVQFFFLIFLSFLLLTTILRENNKMVYKKLFLPSILSKLVRVKVSRQFASY